MILVTRSVVILVAAVLLALPAAAAADGIMLVQAGAFWMGRDNGPADEAPQHRVYVRDVWIERHKVTNAEFAAFLNATGLRPPGSERRYDEDDADARIHLSGGRWTPDPGFDDHPVVEVSWFGARGDDLRLYPWGTWWATFASGHPLASGRIPMRRTTDARAGRGAAAGHHFVGFRCATSEDLGGY